VATAVVVAVIVAGVAAVEIAAAGKPDTNLRIKNERACVTRVPSFHDNFMEIRVYPTSQTIAP
jgi:hypothetical protein